MPDFTPLLLALLLPTGPVPGETPSPAAALSPAAAQESGLPDHTLFTEVLREFVRPPHVDYAALTADREGLDAYLQRLAGTPEVALEAAPREEQLAFWINAYNACMLQRVVDHYPLSSRAGPGLVGRVRNRLAGRPANSVWQIRDVFTGAACTVAGRDRSLDEIEHAILRPMGEPRIHFAINCAARSCPPLVTEAYEGSRLEAQLDARVRGFVATPAQLQVNASDRSLRVNPILDWFGEDFGGAPGVLRFLAEYLPGDGREVALDPEARLLFSDYDWTLNDLPR